MVWYLGVMVNIHNDRCLIYTFMGEVLNDTPNIFNKQYYYFWYKELRNQFLSVMIYTTPKMFIFK